MSRITKFDRRIRIFAVSVFAMVSVWLGTQCQAQDFFGHGDGNTQEASPSPDPSPSPSPDPSPEPDSSPTPEPSASPDPAPTPVPVVEPTPTPKTKPSNPIKKAVSPDEAEKPVDELTPVKCWWRSNRTMVRVGEVFKIILTCQIISAATVQAIIDESQLLPEAVSLLPYEMVGGSGPVSVDKTPFRFYQYEYRLKIIQPDVFGKEVPIPELSIPYRIRYTAVGQYAVINKDQEYKLKPYTIKIASLVPKDAKDIRDFLPDTLSDGQRLKSYSRIALVVAGLLFGGGFLLVGLAGLRYKKSQTVQDGLLSKYEVLKAIQRGLAKAKTDPANSRTEYMLAVLRICAQIMAENKLSQRILADGEGCWPGEILVTKGRRNPQQFAVSASVTLEQVEKMSFKSTSQMNAFKAAFNWLYVWRYKNLEAVNDIWTYTVVTTEIVVRDLLKLESKRRLADALRLWKKR